MNFFCDNEACPCHVESPEGADRFRYVAANGNTVDVKRFHVALGSKENPKKVLHLCSVCVNVVSLINKHNEN